MSDNQNVTPIGDGAPRASGSRTEKPVKCAVSWNALMNICDDEEILAEITQAFCLDVPKIMEQLREAAGQNEWETVRAYAHRLKGATATVGAILAADKSSELEQNCKSSELGAASKLVQELRQEIEELVEFLDQPNWIELAQAKTSD